MPFRARHAKESVTRVLQWWMPIVLLVVTPAYADDISGTYVGTGPGGAFLMQIVETLGGQLTGRYEQTVLRPGGKVDRVNVAVTGASDGHTVVVTFKYAGLLSESVTASGHIEGTTLYLSGAADGGSFTLNLAKSDEKSYQTHVADLEGQAKRKIESEAKTEMLARLNELTSKMLKYSSAAEGELTKFPPIEERYRTITEMMNSALARQRMIFGLGQAGAARSQIGVAINQAGVEAEQLHAGMQSADQGIGGQIQDLVKELAEVSPSCRYPASGQDDALREACSKFQNAGQKFKASVTALTEAFRHAEQIWVGERQKQQAIVQASDIASR